MRRPNQGDGLSAVKDPERVALNLPLHLAHLSNLAYWSTKHVALILGCAEVTVRTWRVSGAGPKYLAITPKQIRYRPADVAEWLQKRERSSTSQSA